MTTRGALSLIDRSGRRDSTDRIGECIPFNVDLVHSLSLSLSLCLSPSPSRSHEQRALPPIEICDLDPKIRRELRR